MPSIVQLSDYEQRAQRRWVALAPPAVARFIDPDGGSLRRGSGWHGVAQMVACPAGPAMTANSEPDDGLWGVIVIGLSRGMTSKCVPKIVPMFQAGTRTTKQRRGLCACSPDPDRDGFRRQCSGRPPNRRLPPPACGWTKYPGPRHRPESPAGSSDGTNYSRLRKPAQAARPSARRASMEGSGADCGAKHWLA